MKRLVCPARFIAVVVIALILAVKAFAAPNISVAADDPVLWSNGPDHVTLVIATVTNNGSPISGVTVNFSATLGSIASPGQTWTDGKATVMYTAPTPAVSGTATVTASATVDGQNINAQTTIRLTKGSWSKVTTASGQGTGTSSGTGYKVLEVNGIILPEGGGTQSINTPSCNFRAYATGRSVNATVTGQVAVTHAFTWTGEGNNTQNPRPSRINITEFYTPTRSASPSVGTPDSWPPSGYVTTTAYTKCGTDTEEVYCRNLIVRSTIETQGTPGGSQKVYFAGYKNMSSDTFSDSYNIGGESYSTISTTLITGFADTRSLITTQAN